MATDDLEERIQRATQGDRGATSELLEHFTGYLRTLIQNESSPELRTWIESDDLLQVVYLRVFVGIGGFQTGGADGFRRWLATIARNCVIDASRARRPAPLPIDPERSYAALLEATLADSHSPSRSLQGRELRRALDDALSRLPEICREAIRLYDLQGLTFDEAAARAGCSRSKLFAARLRGLLLLREFLA